MMTDTNKYQEANKITNVVVYCIGNCGRHLDMPIMEKLEYITEYESTRCSAWKNNPMYCYECRNLDIHCKLKEEERLLERLLNKAKLRRRTTPSEDSGWMPLDVSMNLPRYRCLSKDAPWQILDGEDILNVEVQQYLEKIYRSIPIRVNNGHFTATFNDDLITHMVSCMEDTPLSIAGITVLLQSCKQYYKMKPLVWYEFIKKRAVMNQINLVLRE